MEVVSDSSPLHYLVLIDAAEVLPSLFGLIHIPRAVSDELLHVNAPATVRAVVSAPPAWLQVEEIDAEDEAAGMSALGCGERAAITLAASSGPSTLLLLDDWKARKIAKSLGIRVLGTVGVLDLAASEGLLNLPSALERLRQDTNFYVDPRILKAVLVADAERKRSTA